MVLKRFQKRPDAVSEPQRKAVRDPDTGRILYWQRARMDERERRLTERLQRRESQREYTLRLFVEVDDAYEAVLIVLRFLDLARQLGYTSITTKDIEKGSIWTTFTAKVKSIWDKNSTKRAANIVRQTAESWGVDRPQARNSSKMMDSAANFLTAVGNKSVTADFGNIVIAQITDAEGNQHIRVKTFSARDRALHAYSDEKMKIPRELFQALPVSQGDTDDGD